MTGRADEEGRAAAVRALLAHKACLLLVDDVWDAAIATRFRDLGARAARSPPATMPSPAPPPPAPAPSWPT